MKRMIKATAADYYESKFPVHHGNQRYFCYFKDNDNGPAGYEAQLSRIAPYDDADHVWAKIEGNGLVKFMKSGKIIDKMQLWAYDADEYESYDEYVDDTLDNVVVELINMNKDIEPVMVHN